MPDPAPPVRLRVRKGRATGRVQLERVLDRIGGTPFTTIELDHACRALGILTATARRAMVTQGLIRYERALLEEIRLSGIPAPSRRLLICHLYSRPERVATRTVFRAIRRSADLLEAAAAP